MGESKKEEWERTPALRAYFGLQKILTDYRPSKRFARVSSWDVGSETQCIAGKKETREEPIARFQPVCKLRTRSMSRLRPAKVNTPCIGTYTLQSCLSQRSFTMRKQCFEPSPQLPRSSASPLPRARPKKLRSYYTYRVKQQEVARNLNKFELLKPEIAISRSQKTNFHAICSENSEQMLSKVSDLSSQLHQTRLKLRSFRQFPAKPT